ncbi:MAG TPA: EAL domain-containing protein [Pararobbsia sp.]|jgi:diguanylate cyclase (GGDEF)-like protein/PAS domain S-box-containing protein|nr:EAL domain-containing protein [Pararobbsia sp.]
MFRHISIQTLTTVVIALLATLLIAVGASGLYGMDTGTHAHELTYRKVLQLLAVERQEKDIEMTIIKLDRLAARMDVPDAEMTVITVDELLARADPEWNAYWNEIDNAPERAIAEQVNRTRRKLIDIGLIPLRDALRTHELDTAQSLAVDTVPALHRSYAASVENLEDYQTRQSATRFQTAVRAEEMALRITAAIVSVGILSALWAVLLLRDAIARPLQHALDLLGKISQGDMKAAVTIERNDEFGLLLRGLTDMRSTLRNSLDALRSSERNYRVLTEELEAQLERSHITLHSIGDGVITTDANGQVEFLNPVAEQLTGWSVEDAQGLPSHVVFRIVNETTRMAAPNPIDTCLSENRTVGLANHTVLIDRHGKEYIIEDSAAPIKGLDGRTLGAVLVFHDVSEQHRLSDEMSYRATHDALTGLYNRDEFERRLHETLVNTRHDGAAYALMYIDLDQFKLVNDAGGHAAGDRLLKQITDIIHTLLRTGDTFARLGGDEFGLIVVRRSLRHAQALAQKICRTIDAFRFQHGSQRLHTGASIGLVPLDDRWPTTAALMQAADSACYAAKEAGRNRVHTYVEADQMIESRREDMQWVRRLEQSLDAGNFMLYWQHIIPLNDIETGIHGEILLRMICDDGRIIPPGAFFPAAERFQMATRIDRWVVYEVFSWMTSHPDELRNVSTISVNLSGLSIGDRDFRQYMLELLATTQFDRAKLCFEITETAAITNLSDATEFLRIMRAQGVRFALDDFGSGASWFGYLKTLPVDFLKIDGKFVRSLEHDLVDQATVRCIRDIARITGKKTIAECVETESVEALLRTIGIDYTQGFLRHRPEPLAQVFGLSTASAHLSV